MPYELGRALLLSEALTPDALAKALFAVATEGVPLPRVLIALQLIDPAKLDEELARADAPVVQNVAPVRELVDALPAGLCSRLLALPIRSDPRTGTVDVAVVDARCPHAAQEIGFFLKAPVRTVRAPLAALERALDRSTSPMHVQSLAAPIWVIERTTKPTPLWGTPKIRPSSLPPVNARGRLELVESDVPPVLRGPSIAPSVTPSTAPSTLISANSADSSMPPSVEVAIPLMRRSSPALAPPRVPEITSHAEANGPPLPFPDASHVLSAMRSALDRDEVLHALLVGTRVVARKVALFAVKKEAFLGWRCTPEFADESRLRETKIKAGLPSAFSTAIAAGHYLGPIFKSEAHDPLLALMGRATKDVAVTVVRVKGHATILVVADELADAALGTQRMDELARAAGEALARILRRTTR